MRSFESQGYGSLLRSFVEFIPSTLTLAGPAPARCGGTPSGRLPRPSASVSAAPVGAFPRHYSRPRCNQPVPLAYFCSSHFVPKVGICQLPFPRLLCSDFRRGRRYPFKHLLAAGNKRYRTKAHAQTYFLCIPLSFRAGIGLIDCRPGHDSSTCKRRSRSRSLSRRWPRRRSAAGRPLARIPRDEGGRGSRWDSTGRRATAALQRTVQNSLTPLLLIARRLGNITREINGNFKKSCPMWSPPPRSRRACLSPSEPKEMQTPPPPQEVILDWMSECRGSVLEEERTMELLDAVGVERLLLDALLHFRTPVRPRPLARVLQTIRLDSKTRESRPERL